MGLIKGGDETGYRELVDKILAYGDDNDLILNVDKTKELIMDFRKKNQFLQPLVIKGMEVEKVESYKFLGLHVSSNLSWTINTVATVKKAQRRLYFIRLLRKAGLSRKPLIQAYRGLVESILTNGITVWFGSTTGRKESAPKSCKDRREGHRSGPSIHGYFIYTTLQEESYEHSQGHTPPCTFNG